MHRTYGSLNLFIVFQHIKTLATILCEALTLIVLMPFVCKNVRQWIFKVNYSFNFSKFTNLLIQKYCCYETEIPLRYRYRGY